MRRRRSPVGRLTAGLSPFDRKGGLTLKEAYIGFPSLTEAQRASDFLGRNRCRNRLVRMPSLPGKSSCAYGLLLAGERLDAALGIIRSGGWRIGRVLLRETDGTLREREP